MRPGSAFPAKAVRCDDSPLGVGQNCADQGCSPLFATLNQSSADLGIPKRQQALVRTRKSTRISDSVLQETLTNIPEFRHNNGFVQACDFIAQNMPIAPSIDNFLHTHSADEAIVKVGKLLIARSILLAEKESTLIVKDRLNDDRIDFARGLKFSEGAEVPPPNSSWLGEYFRILVAGSSFDDFIGSIEKVTFVSFNYDRCIEQYLLYAARQYFAVSNEALSDVAEKIRVIHPHGSVGSLSVSSGIIPTALVVDRFGPLSGSD